MDRRSGKYKYLREWLAILAVLGLYLTALPALFAWPAERILFQPDTYKQVLRAQDAYASYPVWFGELLARGGDRILPGSSAEIFLLLESSRYEQVIREIFPQTWVEEQVDGLIDQIWAYLNFQTEQLELLVDLRPIKTHLRGSGAPQIVSTIVDGLPPCSVEDLLDYALRALTGEAAGLPLCRPPEELVGLANRLVGGLLQGMAAAVPDHVDLADLGRVPIGLGGAGVAAARQGWFDVYRLIRQVGPWLPWLAVLMLLLVMVTGHRTRRGLLFWTGMGLLLPGISGLVIVSLLFLWVNQAMPVLIEGIFGRLVIGSLVVELLAEVGWKYLSAASLSALILGLAGVVVINGAVGRISRRDAKAAK